MARPLGSIAPASLSVSPTVCRGTFAARHNHRSEFVWAFHARVPFRMTFLSKHTRTESRAWKEEGITKEELGEGAPSRPRCQAYVAIGPQPHQRLSAAAGGEAPLFRPSSAHFYSVGDYGRRFRDGRRRGTSRAV